MKSNNYEPCLLIIFNLNKHAKILKIPEQVMKCIKKSDCCRLLKKIKNKMSDEA
jgi:hypothetical protein